MAGARWWKVQTRWKLIEPWFLRDLILACLCAQWPVNLWRLQSIVCHSSQFFESASSSLFMPPCKISNRARAKRFFSVCNPCIPSCQWLRPLEALTAPQMKSVQTVQEVTFKTWHDFIWRKQRDVNSFEAAQNFGQRRVYASWIQLFVSTMVCQCKEGKVKENCVLPS